MKMPNKEKPVYGGGRKFNFTLHKLREYERKKKEDLEYLRQELRDDADRDYGQGMYRWDGQ